MPFFSRSFFPTSIFGSLSLSLAHSLTHSFSRFLIPILQRRWREDIGGIGEERGKRVSSLLSLSLSFSHFLSLLFLSVLFSLFSFLSSLFSYLTFPFLPFLSSISPSPVSLLCVGCADPWLRLLLLLLVLSLLWRWARKEGRETVDGD